MTEENNTNEAAESQPKMTNVELKAMLDQVSQIVMYLADARNLLDGEYGDGTLNDADKEAIKDLPIAEVFFIDKTIQTEYHSLIGKRQRVDEIVAKYFEWAERYNDILIYNQCNLWNKTIRSEMEDLYGIVDSVRPLLKKAGILDD